LIVIYLNHPKNEGLSSGLSKKSAILESIILNVTNKYKSCHKQKCYCNRISKGKSLVCLPLHGATPPPCLLHPRLTVAALFRPVGRAHTLQVQAAGGLTIPGNEAAK
jgi:hypothetical protein